MTKKTSKLTDKKGESKTAFTAQATGTSDGQWNAMLERFDAYKSSFRTDAEFEAEQLRKLHELEMKGYR